MAEAEQREVVWTRSAREDLKKIYEFVSSLQGEEKAYLLVELVVKSYLIVFRQIGQVVFINRVFDSRQNSNKLDL